MTNWKEVWDKKGLLNSEDPKEIDGFSETVLDPVQVAEKIKNWLQISPNDRVLEVGCGAGMIAQYLDCDYVGVDYSKNIVKKHIKLFGNSILQGEASDLIFKDKSFDKVFAYSVFQYFPDHQYSQRAISEMIRVSKKLVMIGDLPFASHSPHHLLYPQTMFEGWELSEGYYNPSRYNALLRIKD